MQEVLYFILTSTVGNFSWCLLKAVFYQRMKIALSVSRFTFSGTGSPEGLKACNFIKKRLQHRYFPVEFAKCWRTPFFKEYRQWMLLHIFPWINLDTVFSRLNLFSRLISIFLDVLGSGEVFCIRVDPLDDAWDKLFKNGPSKICGRHLKKLKGYGLPKQTRPLQIF